MSERAERLLTVAEELLEVSRLVDDDDLAGALERFVARVAATVPGCAMATVTLRAETGAETVAAAGDDGQGALETPPLSHLGPIAEALQYREARRVDDTNIDQRWPHFSALMGEEGYRSCLVLPIPARRASSTAVLSLYSRKPHEFDETVHDIVLLLTLHAGVVFDNAQLFQDSRSLVDQLNTALENRQTIGQAQGLLMRHFGCESDQGFDLLRTASQNTNTKLRDAAAALVSAHEKDDFANALAEFRIEPDAVGRSRGR